MYRRYIQYAVVLLALSLAAALPAFGQYGYDTQSGYDNSRYGYDNFTRGELDELVGPIALYPDPLLAQVLPAATFADEIPEAAAFVSARRGYGGVDDQDWDISVRSICHYPPVLTLMSNRPDWTASLGQAYLNQPDDVMDSIQRLRHRALDFGYLRSTSQQQVIVDGNYIRIVPAESRYIYVPRYDPQVVYVRRARSSDTLSNIFSFGLGFIIGSWLNRDTDWDRHRVYYHGWNGGGWVGRSRSNITINNIYVNNRYNSEPIRLNRALQSRDTRTYRNEIRRNVGKYRPPVDIRRPTYTGNRAPVIDRTPTIDRRPTVIRPPTTRRSPAIDRTPTNDRAPTMENRRGRTGGSTSATNKNDRRSGSTMGNDRSSQSRATLKSDAAKSKRERDDKAAQKKRDASDKKQRESDRRNRSDSD